MAFLTVRGPQGRRLHELGPATLVGRGEVCDVSLDDPLSSKRHAEIRCVQGKYHIRDLNSTNGTLVCGRMVKDETALEDGDEIVVGSTTLVFTRGAPPFAETNTPIRSAWGVRETPPKGSDTAGLRAAEVEVLKVPAGTQEMPLEQFGLRRVSASAAESHTITSMPADSDVGGWLRSLYRLLREANQCTTEDELFGIATRILADALPRSRVRVLFESANSDDDDEGENNTGPRPKGPSMRLTIWSDPERQGKKTSTNMLEDRWSAPRVALLRRARDRCVAVLSPDVESDARIADELSKQKQKPDGSESNPAPAAESNPEAEKHRERISLLIAPLLVGRTAIGYLVAERSFRTGGLRHNANGPLTQAHLEFLAAVAYPLATMLLKLRRWQSALDEAERLREAVAGRHEIVGSSQSIRDLLSVIQRIAPLMSPVLILGESGTGKGLVARALHSCSNRRKGPFEAINCAALPENIIESELFGHIRGAFTGAVSDRAGIFELASGGTLFLDEIGDLPLPAQAKLLRVLEENQVCRVGESRLRDTDCRIVAATNRNLSAEVDSGRFRRDLYFRLRVLDLMLSPLRDRLDDLPMLCAHLLLPFGNFTLDPAVLNVFRRYSWPGNIRELRNVLERMAVLAKGNGPDSRLNGIVLNVDDISLDIRRVVQTGSSGAVLISVSGPANLESLDGKADPAGGDAAFVVRGIEMLSLEQLQTEYARWVVNQSSGNKSKAAKVLGIQRSTLYAWTSEAKGQGGDIP